jgi:ferrous iron transport protein B
LIRPESDFQAWLFGNGNALREKERAGEFITVAWPILIVGSLILSLLQFYKWEVYVNNLFRPITYILGLPAAVGTTLIFGIMRKELSLVMLTEALGTPQITTALKLTQLLTFTILEIVYFEIFVRLEDIAR